ncbi:hypothetical protein ACRRTK_004451 [Alexandromys fortis]
MQDQPCRKPVFLGNSDGTRMFSLQHRTLCSHSSDSFGSNVRASPEILGLEFSCLTFRGF